MSASEMNLTIRLREVVDSDLPIFFEQEHDPEGRHMAAFVPPDPDDEDAFLAHWAKIRGDPAIISRTILFGEEVAGHLFCFEMEGQPTVGYWLGKEFWGKGIATRGLQLFLEVVPKRPLYARVVKDNAASIRVLEKGGFVIVGEDSGFAAGRDAEVEEYIMRLEL